MLGSHLGQITVTCILYSRTLTGFLYHSAWPRNLTIHDIWNKLSVNVSLLPQTEKNTSYFHLKHKVVQDSNCLDFSTLHAFFCYLITRLTVVYTAPLTNYFVTARSQIFNCLLSKDIRFNTNFLWLDVVNQ